MKIVVGVAGGIILAAIILTTITMIIIRLKEAREKHIGETRNESLCRTQMSTIAVGETLYFEIYGEDIIEKDTQPSAPPSSTPSPPPSLLPPPSLSPPPQIILSSKFAPLATLRSKLLLSSESYTCPDNALIEYELELSETQVEIRCPCHLSHGSIVLTIDRNGEVTETKSWE